MKTDIQMFRTILTWLYFKENFVSGSHFLVREETVEAITV